MRPLLGLGLLLLTGCFSSQEVLKATATASSSPSETTVISTGSKAVKIIFRNTASLTTGSFGVPSGSGSQTASVFFDVDGSTVTSKPGWLQSLEVGITGSTGDTCSKFTENNDTTAFNCSLAATAGAADAVCSGPAGYLRVSEKDCDAVAVGSGALSDPVYVRFKINRGTDVLGSGENLLAVYEYSGASTSPHIDSTCFSTGFTPEACSPFTWKFFTRSDSVSSPFITLIPPVFSPVSTAAAGAASAGSAVSSDMITTRQVVIPLSGLATGFDTFTLNRIKRGTAYSDTRCSANSPLCNGVIFYSLTLYRI